MFRSDRCLSSGKAKRIAVANGAYVPESAAALNWFRGWAWILEVLAGRVDSLMDHGTFPGERGSDKGR